MMARVHVSLKKGVDNSYDIFIGSGAFSAAIDDAVKMPWAASYCIITDAKVNRIFQDKIAAALKKLNSGNMRAEVVAFPAGERSKNLKTVSDVCEELARRGFGRDSGIIAFGGGVVGDLAGFVAAVFCRGVQYIHVSTTLLAMVDSSIGGKTAVDLTAGKNMAGVFYQPRAVYSDTGFLKALPGMQLRNGLAEMIKSAVIADEGLFSFIEGNVGKILSCDEAILTEAIRRCCEIKKSIVEKDEREAGLRMVLNFGHTIGHAVEKASSYATEHGEAVAQGMAVEAQISEMRGLLGSNDTKRLCRLLSAAGLPVSVKYPYSQLAAAMKADKKAREGRPRFVLPERIGMVHNKDGNYAFEVEESIVKEAVSKCVRI